MKGKEINVRKELRLNSHKFRNMYMLNIFIFHLLIIEFSSNLLETIYASQYPLNIHFNEEKPYWRQYKFFYNEMKRCNPTKMKFLITLPPFQSFHESFRIIFSRLFCWLWLVGGGVINKSYIVVYLLYTGLVCHVTIFYYELFSFFL